MNDRFKQEDSRVERDCVRAFELEIERVREQKEAAPGARVVVAVSDLNPGAAQEQQVAVLSQAPTNDPFVFSVANSVQPYNLISAAHELSVRFAETHVYPPGSIFLVTVDPHVGQNGESGENVVDKRVIAQYQDGTFVIGPAHSYLRAGEKSGRGPIVRVVEIDKNALIQFGFTEERGNDVFDGLRRFAPAAAALLHDIDLQHLGRDLHPSIIPDLLIPRGTVTEIDHPYGNLRVEHPCHDFVIGADIAVRNPKGELLLVAKRTEAFDGSIGSIVAATGSKDLIGGGDRALYFAAVQKHLDQVLFDLTGRKVEVGEQLFLDHARVNDLRDWTRILLRQQIENQLQSSLSHVKQSVLDILAEATLKVDFVRGVFRSRRSLFC